MTDLHTKTIDKMFEFNLWANIEVIEFCRGLDDEQLSFEVTGAYGGIRSFLGHIIRAENYYISRLTGSPLWDDDLNWDNLSLDTLLERAKLSGQKLIDVASKCDPNTQHEAQNQGNPFSYFNWTVLAQAFSHGVEHRTHIKVLLTHLGVEHHDLSLWDFVELRP